MTIHIVDRDTATYVQTIRDVYSIESHFPNEYDIVSFPGGKDEPHFQVVNIDPVTQWVAIMDYTKDPPSPTPYL